jgi:TonB family protein
MDVLLDKHEKENKRKGVLVSAVIHTLLLALILLPLLTFPDPPPGQEGILVNLGSDFGQGEENAAEAETSVTEPVEETVPEETEEMEETEEDPLPEEPVEETQDAEAEPTPDREVVETEDPEAIALKKRQEEEAARKKKEAEEAAEAARKQREAEEAAAAAAAAAEAEAEATKDKYTNVFNTDDGDGKGNTGTPGNQGDPDGDPDSSILEGQSVGAGDLGGGLVGRGVSYKHQVDNPTNSSGKVVVKVCVDNNGKVTSAEATLQGTTATNPTLKQIAVNGAKKWKFSPSAVGKQCGTITYTFLKS